jgi:hypothetical protein
MMEMFTSTGTPLINYIAEPWERDPQRCLETNLEINHNYPFATHEVFKYIQCGIKKQDMKMYYDNVLKEEITALHFRSFKNGDGVQKLVASKPADQAVGE